MYIIWLAYLFVVVLFCLAQENMARGVVWLVLLAILPTLLVAWILRVRRRNQLLKLADRQPASLQDDVAK